MAIVYTLNKEVYRRIKIYIDAGLRLSRRIILRLIGSIRLPDYSEVSEQTVEVNSLKID